MNFGGLIRGSPNIYLRFKGLPKHDMQGIRSCMLLESCGLGAFILERHPLETQIDVLTHPNQPLETKIASGFVGCWRFFSVISSPMRTDADMGRPHHEGARTFLLIVCALRADTG